ncbi:hypothetical protein O8P98_002882 [Listeria innocua]|uniref:hypothetical protein n=1 Tax=Listeria TaxID=1637 RepID=UPI0015C3E366|nr:MULTISPECIES: hypothetical protein [Listeria]EAF4787819.1 hypothetical protein [Listeria monocytogenes]EIL9506277.1 hypothetical protein [Listeria innocua]ELD8348793.1 hypothetical protein [Listeria innocua]HAC0150960.1 hypothetical protein [Listeria monocytogenes]HAC0720405.1 hypothetical protein [Listeria monocytogenes]
MRSKEISLSIQIPRWRSGPPQGIAYYDGVIYFYTNNLITKINENGKVLGQEYLSLKGESEGIEVNKENGKIIIGYNGNNRVYEQK